MAEKKKVLYIVEAMGGGVFTYIVDLANICVGTFHPTGWIFWIAKAIFVCGVSFLCVFALYGKSEGFQIILGKVRKCLPQNMRR